MAIIVTGAAGFIGHSVAHRLLDRGEDVVGIDNFNDYYDPSLKDARAATLHARRGFRLERIDIADEERMAELVPDNREIGRASGRVGGWQDWERRGVSVTIKKKT